jgi:hypothetical protein
MGPMNGYTFDGYATLDGLGPLPVSPTFTVWGPDIELDGTRWLDFWDLIYGLEPVPKGRDEAARQFNPPSRIDLRHGNNAPGRPWVAVSTIPKLSAVRSKNRPWGHGPTELMDAVLHVELRLNGTLHLPVQPLTATVEDLHDPAGRWHAEQLEVAGDFFDGWIIKCGDAWGAAVELESVYLGITASKVSQGSFDLSVRKPVSI